MWAVKDNGIDVNWADAKVYCENYRGGGYTDWRMPTQDELAEIYDSNKPTKLIHISNCCPWASETEGFKAAYFDFVSGKRGWFNKYIFGTFRALPVRSGE